MKTILLTGGTGFLGSNLLKELIKNKYNVILLKRTTSNITKIKDILNNDLVKIYDIDKKNIDEIFNENNIDIVIHTATSYGRKNEEVTDIINSNLVFPLKLLESSIKNNINIFFNFDTFYTKKMSPNSNLKYYIYSKKQFLEYGKIISKFKKISFVNLKLQHLYGPGDDENKFIGMIISKIFKGEKKIDLTKGEQIRDFIYIDDVITILLNLINKRHKSFEPYDIGTGIGTSIKNLVLKIKNMTNSEINLNFGKINYMEGEIMKSISKSPYFGKGFNFTNIDEGLKKTIDYFYNQNK